MTITPLLHTPSLLRLDSRLPQPLVGRWMISIFISGMAITATNSVGLASAFTSHPPNSSAPQETLISQLPGPITLQLNDSGDAVSALQRRLAELGFYNGPISGFFGELTETAVKNFQSNQGLTADGVVGTSTTDALRRAPASGSTSRSGSAGGLTIGSTGSEVTQVQNGLTQLGFYNGPVTGFYGELTETAVRNFQSSNGLTVDGVVGPATLAAIQGASQSSSSSAPDPNDGLLEQGETGPSVADVQRRLKNLNYYNGPIDGDFGSLTVDAVTRFQRAQGLTADGVVGPATLAAISRVEGGSASASNRSISRPAGAPSPSTSQGSSVSQQSVIAAPPNIQANVFPTTTTNPFPSTGGTSLPSGVTTASPEAIMALQRNLQEQGFYTGPIDGVMSFETQQAISAARAAYGISANDFDNNPL